MSGERDRYMEHVTLTTGHRRRSPRSEVFNHTIREMRPVLERALREDGHSPIPRLGGYSITARAHDTACIVTLHGPGPDEERVPVLTTGVAVGPQDSEDLWRLLHSDESGLELATSPDDPPPTPWCGDRLEIGAALISDPDGPVTQWTGDYSRSIAWTWIEMVDAGPR